MFPVRSVINAAGTSRDPKPDHGCGSWIDHWRARTHRSGDRCSNLACLSVEDIVGAHVFVDEPLQMPQGLWILPLCKACNNQPPGTRFRLRPGSLVVSPHCGEGCS